MEQELLSTLVANAAMILAGLLLVTGLTLTIYLRFPQLRYPFLGLKLIVGTLDWFGSKGKITPGRAFAASTLSSMIPGAFLGTLLAILIAGPGVLLWIWIASFFLSPMHFVLATLAHRNRSRTSSGSISGSVSGAVRGMLRSRWLSILSGIFFLPAAIAVGACLPVAFLGGAASGTFSLQNASFPLGPTGIGFLAAIALVFMAAGGIRRIGLISKYAFLIGALLLLFSVILGPWPVSGLFSDVWHSFLDSRPMPVIFALATYFSLTEIGSGKSASIMAAIRTDHPAKAGLSMQLNLLLESLVSLIALLLLATISGAGSLYEWYLTSGGPARSIASVFDPSLYDLFRAFYFRAPTEYNVSGLLLLLASAVMILSGVAGWWYALYNTASSLAGRFLSSAMSLLFFFALVGSGLAMEFFGGSYFAYLLLTSLFLLMVASMSGAMVSILLMRTSKIELQHFLDSREARAAIADDFLLILFSVLPQNLISKAFGIFSLIPLPRFLRKPIIGTFASAYKINLEEAEKPLDQYPSLNAFFIRRLKDGVRPVDASPHSIVSPVDGRISRFGNIDRGLLIQTKGIVYTLKDLLESPEELPHYQDGKYMVIYLSPQDYHRMHTPIECDVEGFNYSPGKLFPVNDIAVEGLHGLFPKNERLTSFLKCNSGRIAMIKVGATNVGKIRVTYDSIRTNRFFRRKRAIRYDAAPHLAKGAEIGRFEMGSTVILLFERDTMQFAEGIFEGARTKLGEPIGQFLRK
ncbi:MAG: phosphatidylserine decarboxylase [Leptospiraceae bacterium]|nr:phosphatidylserine decarboxylase [Leptospiraceae bacterium]